MHHYLFIFLLLLIFTSFYYKKRFINYLKNELDIYFIKTIYIDIFLFILLFIIIFIGGFNIGSTKDKFKNISDAYEQMKTPEKQQRPHVMFDVDTYPKSKLW